jgi:hypothetical protein
MIAKVMIDNPLKPHIWRSAEPRKIEIEGKLIFHHHCQKCGRDFAREASQADWKPIYIGTFSVKFLDDSVGQQWVSEPCPETPSPMVARPSKKRMVQRRP